MLGPKVSEINRKFWIPQAIGALGGIAAAYISGRSADERADDAWDREKDASARAFDRSYGAYKKRYQDTTADMREAGLNPILAATGGFNVGTSPVAPKANAPMATTPTYEFASSAKDWTQAQTNVQEEKKAEMEIRKIRSEALRNIAETYVARAKKGLITKQERETVKKIQLLEKQVWTEIANFKKTMKDAYRSVEQRKKIMVEINHLKASLEQLKKVSNAYKGPIGALLGYINAITGAMRISAGGAVTHSTIRK